MLLHLSLYWPRQFSVMGTSQWQTDLWVNIARSGDSEQHGFRASPHTTTNRPRRTKWLADEKRRRKSDALFAGVHTLGIAAGKTRRMQPG